MDLILLITGKKGAKEIAWLEVGEAKNKVMDDAHRQRNIMFRRIDRRGEVCQPSGGW